jgi:hypothetical protein
VPHNDAYKYVMSEQQILISLREVNMWRKNLTYFRMWQIELNKAKSKDKEK